MARLGVAVDMIAVLREARQSKLPDPVSTAVVADNAGADGIICHIREDRKYVKDRDLFVLKETIRSHLNVCMPGTTDMLRLALKIQPDMVTIVPQSISEGNTVSGLEVAGSEEFLRDVVEQLHANNIIVCFTIEPDLEQVKAAARTGVDYIELHAGTYANAPGADEEDVALDSIRTMALAGNKFGLGISVGHGLNYLNVQSVADIEHIEEINVGHALLSRALIVGLPQAIRDMNDLIK